jgi:hypothetical protein
MDQWKSPIAKAPSARHIAQRFFDFCSLVLSVSMTFSILWSAKPISYSLGSLEVTPTENDCANKCGKQTKCSQHRRGRPVRISSRSKRYVLQH